MVSSCFLFLVSSSRSKSGLNRGVLGARGKGAGQSSARSNSSTGLVQ
jgi:hypothetical protein